MDVTVAHPVSDRSIKEDSDLLAWANNEALPVLREIRKFANAETVGSATSLTAGDGLMGNLWASDPMPTGVAWQVVADVIGRGGGEWVNYRRVAFFVNESGTPVQVGVTEALWSFETSAGPDVELELSGQTVVLNVQDDGAHAFTWDCIVRVFATPRP